MNLIGKFIESNIQTVSITLQTSFQTIQRYFFSFVGELIIALLAIGLAKLIQQGVVRQGSINTGK